MTCSNRVKPGYTVQCLYNAVNFLEDFHNRHPSKCMTLTWTNWSPFQWLVIYLTRPEWVNTLRPRQNGRHFPDNIFKWIFLNEDIWISINISLKFVPRGPINNIPTLVQVMAWRRPGDKPLSEPMMVRLVTHICITWPQWVNGFL